MRKLLVCELAAEVQQCSWKVGILPGVKALAKSSKPKGQWLCEGRVTCPEYLANLFPVPAEIGLSPL